MDYNKYIEKIKEVAKIEIVDCYPVVKELYHTPSMCEDCGVWCDTQRVVEMKYLQTPEPHWRSTCKYCKKAKNPETKKFDIEKQDINAFFRLYFK